VLFSLIGFYSLILGLSLSVIIIFFSIKNFKDSKDLDKKILSFVFLQFFLVVVSFLGLILSFVFSDFSNETVFNHSHTTKPLFYKISGTWGNHEGSLLLWLLVLTLFIFLFLLRSKEQPKQYRILTLLFQQIIIIGFFIFLIKTSNPFNYIFPVPQEGLGLNPILQDPALAIHPPILYLGYVGTSIVFSSALSATSLNYISKKWATHIKKWVLISWFFLTLGILLGSIWAYYELGWGGFWFWDPVENVSLMPWLALTTLLHCILVLQKRLILTSWVIILSIATFTLSMCGTFLVRSGILNSVHTFANDPERGLFILIFLFTLIFLSLFIFFLFHKVDNKNTDPIFLLSKETSILVNNWFMMYFLSVILIGTVYPIFLDVISSQKISVGPPFYHKLIIPFLIPFLLVMAIGPKLRWIKSNLDNKTQLGTFLIISFLLSAFIIKNLDLEFLLNTVLIGSALYLFFTTLRDFFIKKFKNLSQNIAHFGFSLLILSILFNNFFSTEVITNLKVGENFNSENFQIKFENINQQEKQNYKSIIGEFKIENSKGLVEILYPELRIYNQPNITTSEADIKTNLFVDKFMTMNLVQNQEYFNIRYQVKPFMIFIWISVVLVSFGGLISFFKKKQYEK
jgi:cytochrome c-type biogenesis protein CcmF